jgi:hypothetical protein
MSQEAPTIDDEGEYRSVVRQLDQAKKPPVLLRLLMNALESYCQSKKMGWSRPQNKYGLAVIESFRLDRSQDQLLIDLVMKTFVTEFKELDEESSRYVRALHQDPSLMDFIFVHDSSDERRAYEGVTFSFGRVTSGQNRHRDRLDLIVEFEIKNGRSQGISRNRAYVDPFKLPIRKNLARMLSHEPPQSREAQELLPKGSELYSC